MIIKPENDGIDHINIYSKGKTRLGRLLSNWSEDNIKISLGGFKTIEGLIFFLGCFEDRLRKTNGYESKRLGELWDRNIRLPEDIFRGYIIEAMYQKSINDIPRLMSETDLPFTHYYVYGDKIVKNPKWDWQIQEWEMIRKRLK